MSVATLRYDAPREARARIEPRHQRAEGRLALRFARGGGGTVLADLDQHSPCRALFPRPRAGEPLLAMVINTAGGLTGGDRIAFRIEAATGAAATVTTQAAEKIYRSLGPDAQVETRLAVADDALLEWLPQETILFDGACLERRLNAAIADRGRFIACEMLVFGRAARGETMRSGRLREHWRIERGGRLAWIDRLGLSDDIGAQLDGMGFGGARALATAIYVGRDAASLLPAVRDAAEREMAGATLVNGILIVRLLGADPGRVRDGLARILGHMRRSGAVPPGASSGCAWSDPPRVLASMPASADATGRPTCCRFRRRHCPHRAHRHSGSS